MTEADVLDGLLLREGGFTNDPDDAGGPTKYGITAATLGNWRGWTRPATAQEVEDLEPQEASDIYRERYIAQPGFTPENIPFEPLRVQLIDFGVNSGPERAIRWLQRTLGVEADGVLGPVALTRMTALMQFDAIEGVVVWRLINDALVAARLYMIDTATDHGTVNKKFEEGLESRALSFFLAKPPVWPLRDPLS